MGRFTLMALCIKEERCGNIGFSEEAVLGPFDEGLNP